MHILLEGIIPKEISLFLNIAVRERHWFSLKELNDAISNFKFHRAVSRSDKPRLFESDLKVVSSASASLVLILHIPLILDGYLPENSPLVKSLVRLAQITQLVSSPVFTAEAVGARPGRIGCQPPRNICCVLWEKCSLSHAPHVASRG